MTILSFSKGRSTFNIINNLNQFEDKRSDSVSKISSALRIRKAADSVSESAIGTRLKIEVESLNKVLASTTSAKSALEIAEGGLSQVSRILTRMTSLAMDAKNGYNTDEDREKIDLEFHELKKEIDRIAESTNFNGKKLLTTHVVTIPKEISGTPVKRYVFHNNWLAGTANTPTPRGTPMEGIAAITPSAPRSDRDWCYRVYYEAGSRALKFEWPNWFENPTQWYWTDYVIINPGEIKPGETETYTIPNNHIKITLNEKFDKTKSFGSEVKYSDFYADLKYEGATNDPGDDSEINIYRRQIPVKGISGDIHSNFDLDKIRLSLVRENATGSSQARFVITDGRANGRVLASKYYDFKNGAKPIEKVKRLELSDETGKITIRPYDVLQQLTNTVDVNGSTAPLNMKNIKIGTEAIKVQYPKGQAPGDNVALSDDELPILQPGSLKYLRYYNGSLTKTENVIEGSDVVLEETIITEPMKFQVGTGFSESDTIEMPIEDLTTASLGIEGATFNLLKEEMLSDVIATLKEASSKVENIRSKIGVTSSRIDFAAQNLQTSITNSSAAVSAIFDLDVPTEISELSQIELKQVAAIEALSRDVKAKQNLMKLF